MEPTWVCPAISMPASRNSSKSWLNLREAAASWPLVPREEWTTSPAEWFSSAAVWFRSVWASWNVLLHGGSFKDTSVRRHGVIPMSDRDNLYVSYGWIQYLHIIRNRQVNLTYNIHQQLLASLSDAPEGHVDVLLAWQAVHAIIQRV